MKRNNFKTMLLVGLITLCFFPTLSAKTIYVKTNGVDNNDGLSWETARKTIQAAITTATAEDQIWIQAGTYITTASINVTKNLSFYGGFVGTETTISQRNWTTNKTIVSGSSLCRVFNIYPSITNVTLDGLIIQDGNVQNGAGIYCSVANTTMNVTVKNCIVRNNIANTTQGAGMYVCSKVNASIYNTLFLNNQSLTYAPAVSVDGTAKFYNCTFVNNKMLKVNGLSAAVYLNGPNCEVRNCVFWNNKRVRSVVNQVETMYFSGIFVGTAGSNASISSTATDSVAVSIQVTPPTTLPIVENFILLNSDNTATDGPKFKNPGSIAGVVSDVTTLDGLNYSLLEPSICINAGNNTYMTESYDLAQNTRIYNTNVDLGAYEYGGSSGIVSPTLTFDLVSFSQGKVVSNVEGLIQVLTITGITLKNEQVTNGQVIDLPSGAYIIRMLTSKGFLVQKIVL